MSGVWDVAKRNLMVDKIVKEAQRSAMRLGATSVLIVAFFPDGENLHMLDGGSSPLPPEEVYQKCAAAHAARRTVGDAVTTFTNEEE